jgi:hypothetical protein
VRLPVITGAVIAAAFLPLLASFRGPLLDVKAAIFSLFSVGAAYGVIVAVFQQGYGSSCPASARRSRSSPRAEGPDSCLSGRARVSHCLPRRRFRIDVPPGE